ncbi:MAG: glycoside hydrolase family 15 protein [Pseudomonadota bacterium]
MTRPRYKPIADYALVGDCHGCALVAANGDIDWLTLGRFDAAPMLFPLLDADKGGGWSIRVTGATVTRSYEPSSNVLRTLHDGPDGTLEVLDFMPLGRRADAGPYDYTNLAAPGWAVRRMRVLSGSVAVEMRFAAGGPDWARAEGGMRTDMTDDARSAHLRRADSDRPSATFYADFDLSAADPGIAATIAMAEGDVRHAVLTAAPHHGFESGFGAAEAELIEGYLETTRAFWTEWTAFCRYDGAYCDQVTRSALVLKLLTYAPTGAMVAAATTSLPEEIGGVRNWDYRYCWVRDASLSLYALSAIGYSGEGDAFSRFLMQQPLPRFQPLKIMYGIQGERELTETDLDHLEGYRGSKPVRIGNDAHDQIQLDVYGEMLDLAHVRVRLGNTLNAREHTLLCDVADEVASVWQQPDASLWEARSRPRHYAHSKMMAWVALDRAVDLLGPRDHWVAARDAAKAAMVDGVRDGYIPRVLPFDGDPGGEGMDAALLLAPLHGLDLSVDVMDATVRAVEDELRGGDFVHRYRGGDGLPGEEGAFLICSFWLVDALLATDRAEEARALFERLLKLGNELDLFAEEADPETGAHLGNFPQAFTHLALIGSAVNLMLYDEGGADAIRGSYADRAERAAGATSGLAGVVASLAHGGKPVRLRSSKASVLRLQ